MHSRMYAHRSVADAAFAVRCACVYISADFCFFFRRLFCFDCGWIAKVMSKKEMRAYFFSHCLFRRRFLSYSCSNATNHSSSICTYNMCSHRGEPNNNNNNNQSTKKKRGKKQNWRARTRMQTFSAGSRSRCCRHRRHYTAAIVRRQWQKNISFISAILKCALQAATIIHICDSIENYFCRVIKGFQCEDNRNMFAAIRSDFVAL